MPTIEIPYATNDEQRFYMDDVLSLIEAFGCSLDWYFIEFEPSNWTRTRILRYLPNGFLRCGAKLTKVTE
jgi:hypothetical protein